MNLKKHLKQDFGQGTINDLPEGLEWLNKKQNE